MKIQLEAVHYAYPGGIPALNGVSLFIQPGELVAVVGENGSGKTTLARHLNGLLRPQSGQVRIGDWVTAQHTPAQMSRRVAYVFQNPDEQLFRQSIWDEIAFGPQNLGYTAAEVKAMVEKAVHLTQLDVDLGQNPRDLGLSQRKNVALASALAMQTPILVLDEPTAGLDAGEQDQRKQVIRTIHDQGKTVLMISHDFDFIAETFDRVIRLHLGRISEDMPVKQFFEKKAQGREDSLVNPQIVRLGRELELQQVSLTVDEFIANLAKRPDAQQG